MNPRTVKFSHNWNGKLNCYAFSTIRIDGSFEVGDELKIQLTDPDTKKLLREFKGVVVTKTAFYLDTLTDQMSYLDMGVRAERGREIIKGFYEDPKAGWSQTPVYCYTIVRAESTR